LVALDKEFVYPKFMSWNVHSTTETDENYLKETYSLELEHKLVTTSMLADRFGTSAATVTGMLKKMAKRKWVVYEPYHGVTLTDAGKAIALEVIRHHRLLETYLAKAMGIPRDRVHVEAERLEHALSEYLEQRIDELLDHPSHDPHGSPIPARDGTISELSRLPLSEVPEGAHVEISEVWDRDPQILLRLDKLGLHPHAKAVVLHREPVDELMTIEVERRQIVVGKRTAKHVFVIETG
jgi:DtxR family Mn-dependent transcriptional regulator